MNDRVLSLLGLAGKAGKVASGEFQAEEALRKKKAVLILLAKDASANTKKKFRDKAENRGLPVYEYGSCADLGKAIGKNDRAVAALLDRGFGEALAKKLKGELPQEVHGNED
ncbi:MAG: ribosomal L7Ae/L30e/S12e/Gadd45 family protein [Lachnospiraceae bacterium]|nr:ribosomal L7Ae/L30e/S12e/Gadd45 family protein [Lachnospiraceae bacterium]